MKILAKLVAVSLLTISSAYADPVPVTITGASNPDNNGIWLVDILEDTFDDNSELLMGQVWWGDEALALLFSTSLNGGLGFVGGLSPLFAEGVIDQEDMTWSSISLQPS